ncbi:hypothetical protein PHSY_000428 [Pseudozyma hubeiensis SY62]|uniref:Uncharacterized protein n=1 Tax=Pseudozyma hubeiensis (strain SY62) TaxID=1305764 RepID=R9P476_PSEHS|nr:hypothetical protein PHSY_000428 [Pseudozyma hubeiensis SY62]GAC92870.1 hypothetical protein PHSY_000428 [Pseudozyma hubeiensis SY62]
MAFHRLLTAETCPCAPASPRLDRRFSPSLILDSDGLRPTGIFDLPLPNRDARVSRYACKDGIAYRFEDDLFRDSVSLDSSRRRPMCDRAARYCTEAYSRSLRPERSFTLRTRQTSPAVSCPIVASDAEMFLRNTSLALRILSDSTGNTPME